ncbi:MAG: DNA polymerase III subunit beta [Sphingobacteriales bacterium]|nr:MAG: DNA polymerase III subunit beta [Sphingobacteriales bacterium]
MLFTISTNTLQKQLQLVNGAVGAGAVMPILSDFLFELDGSTLSIIASDMELTMHTDVEVMGTEDGAIAIPAKMLTEVIKNLPEQPLTFVVDEETGAIIIRSQNGEYKIAGENAAEFPEMTTLSGAQTITLNSDLLLAAATKTLFATGTDQLRPAMTGIFCKFDENGAVFVATDAHKLVKLEHTAQTYTENVSFILPRKALTLLKNALPANTIVHLTYNASNALFTFESIKLNCLLVEGRFPDYSVVIPTKNHNIITVDRNELLNATKRAVIFSNKSTFEVVFTLSENTLKLNTQDLDFATESHENIACDYQGEELEIAFNARFLIEMLSAIETDEVRIELSVPFKAGLVLPATQETDEHLLMLIMPIMRHRQ